MGRGKHTKAQAAQLADLELELARGRIYECSLRAKTWQPDGLLDGEAIYVDPRAAILETLLHELMHRRWPTIGERSVERQARSLVVRMDEDAKRHWWAAYQRIKKRGKAVDLHEDDDD